MKTFLIYRNGIAPEFSYSSKEISFEPSHICGDVRVLKSQNSPSNIEMENCFKSPDFYSVEQWIEKQGYSAIRLLTVRELEVKLQVSNKNSQKVTAIRQWADGLIAIFALNHESRNDWPQVPFAFDEVVQEAIQILS